MTYIPPNANGQATMANSEPVVIASDQSAVPISSATLATSAKQDTLLAELQLKADLTETQPVSAASLPLPAGAATLAGQTQPGVDIGDVTINNAAGASAVNIQDGGNSITIDGTVAISGSVAVTGPLTDAQLRATAVPVSLTSTTVTGTVAVTDNAGSLTVDAPVGTPAFVRLSDGAAAIATLPVSLASVPSHAVTNAGTFLVQNNAATPAGTNNIGDVDVLTINGVAPAFGTGVRGATVQRVTIATDDIVPSSQSGTWTVQPGNTANTTPWLTTQTPRATGGATPSVTISVASTNATSLKASAGTVFGIQVFNTNASPRYFKLYNKASAPTVGTDTPVKVITIPGNTAGAGAVVPLPDHGVAFGTGIAWALTTGAAHTDTGAVALSEIIVNIDYI